MDLNYKLSTNTLNFRRTLDRIIDKYSKLQHQDGGVVVDLNNTKVTVLDGYVEQSKEELDKLESKSLIDLRDESLRALDTTRVSQLDFTHQDSGADESCASSISSTKFSMNDHDMTRGDATQLSASLLDESLRNHSVLDLQPEDQDKELEMSLRSHGSSLVKLYPSMISRIERAWHQQHSISEAADSVLRRYRRWRKQSSRIHFKNTSIVTQRHGKPKEATRKRQIVEASDSTVKKLFLGSTPTPWPPLQIATSVMDWKALQHSPEKARREPPRPILVMDLSVSCETSESQQSVLNETLSLSQLREQSSSSPSSPSRPLYSNAKAPFDLSLRSKRLSLAARSPQTDGCSMYATQTTTGKQRPGVYGSPVRQSPLKVGMMMSGVSRSPHSFSRSPKSHSVESFSSEHMRPRLVSASLLSSPLKPPVQRRILYPQDSHHSFQPVPSSPQSVPAAEGRRRLRRHHSFDSTLPSSGTSYSPKKLDEDFVKLYHKFFCQNKSSVFNGPPCRYCGKSSEATRGHSSSALAALALSPHRSLLRKRHRKFSWDNHPQSKRHRYENFASSPGSKRHSNEMLRRRLSTYEYEPSQDGLCYSPSKRSVFPRFSTQQRSADAHQEAWTRADLSISAADLSGLGHHPQRSSFMF